MRRLVVHQNVTVVLDGEADGIHCTVGSVAGSVATLAYPGELAPDLLERLLPGTLGLLVFEHRDFPVALRGAACADPGSPTLEFVVLDGVQLPERRIAERIPLAMPVRVRVHTAPDEGSPVGVIETVSSDLSITGVLLERRPGLGEGPLWKVELVVAGDERPICCDVTVARRTSTHIGVAFVQMPDAEQDRLTDILAVRKRAFKPAG
jgi:PilZ domain-containing protein